MKLINLIAFVILIKKLLVAFFISVLYAAIKPLDLITAFIAHRIDAKKE